MCTHTHTHTHTHAHARASTLIYFIIILTPNIATTNKPISSHVMCHLLAGNRAFVTCWLHYVELSYCMFEMDVSDFGEIKALDISVVIILNITLNVLAIAVIVRYPQLLEDRTTLFIFSMTLSDLANGCTAMPISAALCSSVIPNVRNMVHYFPKIHAVFSTWFTVNSVHSLCWLTVCKMIAITNPLRYEQVLTRNRCYFIICEIWLTGALMAAILTPFVTTWNFDSCIYAVTMTGDISGTLVLFAVIIAFVCPLVAIVYCTTRIFLVILRTHRQITAQVNSIGGENGSQATVPSLTFKSIRSGRNVLIVCLAFIVLTIPFCAFAALSPFYLTEHWSSLYKFAAA